MEKLFSLIGDVTHTKLGGADSYSDQLNCRYTVFLLSLFTLLASARVYIDEPISCFCPAEFSSSQVAFAKKVCWTTNTFHIPIDTELTQESRRSAPIISYYQWMALVFSLQGFLFYLPRPLWRILNKKSGLAVNTITDAAIECQRHRDDKFENNVRYMSQRMTQFLTGLSRRRQAAGLCKKFGLSIYGSYLTIVYLVIKVLYVVNVIGQLFLLNTFLGTDYHLYGFDVMRRMANGEEWTTSSRFPRVTLCDFNVRKLGNIHRYTIQCALPLNLFYEMMFIFLWFWMVFVVTVTACSLVQWVIVSVFFCFQEGYVTDRLRELDDDTVSKAQIGRFTRVYLRRDGCFILRLVSKNAGDRIAAELVTSLWKEYRDKIPQTNESNADSNGARRRKSSCKDPSLANGIGWVPSASSCPEETV